MTLPMSLEAPRFSSHKSKTWCRRSVHLPPTCWRRSSWPRGHTGLVDRRSTRGGVPPWNALWGPVFASTIGTPLDVRNVVRQPDATSIRTRLPAVRSPDPHHSCASLPFARGVSSRGVMDVLRQSHLNLTMDTDCHAMPEKRPEATESHWTHHADSDPTGDTAGRRPSRTPSRWSTPLMIPTQVPSAPLRRGCSRGTRRPD